jgi:hypothetical protein
MARPTRTTTGNEPEVFKENPDEDFEDWWRDMENALYLRRYNLSTDEQTILYVVGYMKDEAKNWFRDDQDKVQQGLEQ